MTSQTNFHISQRCLATLLIPLANNKLKLFVTTDLKVLIGLSWALFAFAVYVGKLSPISGLLMGSPGSLDKENEISKSLCLVSKPLYCAFTHKSHVQILTLEGMFSLPSLPISLPAKFRAHWYSYLNFFLAKICIVVRLLNTGGYRVLWFPAKNLGRLWGERNQASEKFMQIESYFSKYDSSWKCIDKIYFIAYMNPKMLAPKTWFCEGLCLCVCSEILRTLLALWMLVSHAKVKTQEGIGLS